MASLVSSDNNQSSSPSAPAATGEESDAPFSFDPSDCEDTEGSTQRWLGAFRDLEEKNLDNAFCSVVRTTEDPAASSSWWCDAIRSDPIPSEWTVWKSDLNLDDFSALAPSEVEGQEGEREDSTAAAVAAKISDRLQTSLAYSSPMLEKKAADAWARSFVDCMNSGGATAQWFWNTEFNPTHGAQHEWTPVTESTFDACFVAVRPDLNIVAYILLDDED